MASKLRAGELGIGTVVIAKESEPRRNYSSELLPIKPSGTCA
jgi:hypothetical protein